jgi:hypothetical protein
LIDGVDPALMAIVRKATGYDAADRYQTPGELRAALETWQQGSENRNGLVSAHQATGGTPGESERLSR